MREAQRASDAYFAEADRIQAELIQNGVHPWDAIERSHKIIRERRQRRSYGDKLNKEPRNDQ